MSSKKNCTVPCCTSLYCCMQIKWNFNMLQFHQVEMDGITKWRKSYTGMKICLCLAVQTQSRNGVFRCGWNNFLCPRLLGDISSQLDKSANSVETAFNRIRYGYKPILIYLSSSHSFLNKFCRIYTFTVFCFVFWTQKCLYLFF